MSPNVARQLLDSLLPGGSIWTPKDGAGFDQLIDGLADDLEILRKFLADLAVLRNPILTPILSDLEKEYGIVPDWGLSESVRRGRLLAVMTAVSGDGTAVFMQNQLRAAGFDVYVHINDPPADPGTFLFNAPATICGNEKAVCGYEGAVCGGLRGDLLVNGDVYEHVYFTGTICGGLYAVCGNGEAICRDEADFAQQLIEYEIPTDPGYWPLLFFVGGPATRDGAGIITEIATAQVLLSRRDELRRLIVKYKPMFSWGGLIVQYI